MARTGWFGIVVIVAALGLAGAVRLTAQPARAAAPERIALVNANVVNVVTGTVQDGQTLVLSGGRIESIGAAPAAVGSPRHRPAQPLGGARADRRARAHRQPAADARGACSPA